MKTLILIATILWTNQTFADRETITFGIVPQQSASKLAKSWVPICNYLSELTGKKVVFRTAPNIPEFENRLGKGEYDISYMNPYHYTVFSKTVGYRAIANAKDKKIKGILVVRKDSPWKSLDELRGLGLAFPSPLAFAASILTRGEFVNRGIEIEANYVSSHDSVYINVDKGIFEAGGGVKRTFLATDPKVRNNLRVLWETPGYTPHALAVHPRLPASLVRLLQDAFIKMDTDNEALKLLKPLKVKGFQAAEDKNWDDVRSLKFDLL